MRLVFLVALALIGCGRARLDPLESRYREARTLLRAEKQKAAWDQTKAALGEARPDSVWYWRLRLLRAEILLANREGKQADEALNFQLPSGPQWLAEWARYRLCRGFAALLLGNGPEAEQHLREAQSVAQSIGDASLLAEIELRQGTLALAQNHFEDAKKKFDRVIEYASRHGDAYLQMTATGNTGHLLVLSYHYDEAIPWFEQTLANARTLGAATSQARATGNLGYCYFRLGDFDKALDYFQQTEQRFVQAGNRYEIQNWRGSIGSVHLNRREFSEAAADYRQALEIARELKNPFAVADWLNNLAEIAIEIRDWDAAERYNNEALDIEQKLEDQPRKIYSTVNAARIAAGKGDFGRAEQLFRTVIRSSNENPTPLLNAHRHLAGMLAGTGHDRQAEAEFRATAAFVEHESSELLKDDYKLTYFSSVIDFYQDYVDYLMQKGRVATALEVADSSRARVLGDKLRLARAQRKPPTAESLQKIAGNSKAVLLSYWLAPKKSYLWVVTSAGVRSFQLPPAAEIRALVERYDALIQSARDPLAVEDASGPSLYHTLLEPAAELLAKNTRVILSPDGALYSLNFETIPVPGATRHYWIDDVAVSVTPSLGLLSSDPEPRSAPANSMLLVGNPVSTEPQYPVLQFAGQEIASIDRTLPAFRKVILTGAEANPDAYEHADPGTFTLIHFVAHAVANREDPLSSAVILSNHGTGGFKLLARDVIHKPLHAQVVTISACRSAGARVYAGEGLVGFAWAFLEAGARNVIAGLWDVNDRSTAKIMANMYPELAHGRSPADALRAAKLELIRSTGAYRKPYYWAPFQLFTSSLQ
jgi:CHAT domain-containing protein/tetratricopeptide (TPR) repeat protein